MQRSAETLRRMAGDAWRKADEAAASDKPWALRNLRLYQGLAFKWEREADLAERA